MGAAFSVFRSAISKNARSRIEDELRALQQNLGMAREWDVLAEETIARMPRRLRGFSDDLIKIAQIKRVEGHKSAHAALRSRHYTDLLLRLVSWIDSQFGSGAPPTRERKWRPNVLAGPAPRFASEVMRGYHDKVRKLGNEVHKLGVEELHA